MVAGGRDEILEKTNMICAKCPWVFILLYMAYSMLGAALFPESAYLDVSPDAVTLPKVFMLATAVSCISAPTLLKYIWISSGKYLSIDKSKQAKKDQIILLSRECTI